MLNHIIFNNVVMFYDYVSISRHKEERIDNEKDIENKMNPALSVLYTISSNFSEKKLTEKNKTTNSM